MKVRELGRFIRDQRSSASLSLRSFSGLTGVSIPYLSQIERGLRRPSADILNAIAKALRISAETLYIKAGILDERDTATDPVGEILRDGSITDRQKRILIELYQSFREEASRGNGSRTAATKPAQARRRAVAHRVAPAAAPKRSPAKKKRTAPAAKAGTRKRAKTRTRRK